MADRETNLQIKTRPNAGRDAFVVADGTILGVGALVSCQGGYADHWADGANDVFLGIVLGGDGRANDGVIIGKTSDTPPPECRVDTSGVILMHLDSVGGTPTQAKVGDLVYSADSDVASITLSSAGRTHPIGWMCRFRSATDVDVQLFTPSQMLAQATA